MRKKGPSSKSYDVGYGRPPEEFRFRRGQSGNPSGTRRKPPALAPDLRSSLERALNDKAKFRQGDREQVLSKATAGIDRLVDQFADGDRHARRDLIALAERLGVDLTAGQHDALQKSVVAALTKSDQELVDEFIQHYLAERGARERTAAKSQHLKVLRG